MYLGWLATMKSISRYKFIKRNFFLHIENGIAPPPPNVYFECTDYSVHSIAAVQLTQFTACTLYKYAVQFTSNTLYSFLYTVRWYGSVWNVYSACKAITVYTEVHHISSHILTYILKYLNYTGQQKNLLKIQKIFV